MITELLAYEADDWGLRTKRGLGGSLWDELGESERSEEKRKREEGSNWTHHIFAR